MLAALLFLSASPTLERTASIPFPAHIGGVMRLMNEGSEFYVETATATEDMFYRVDVAKGTSRHLTAWPIMGNRYGYLEPPNYFKTTSYDVPGKYEEEITYVDIETGKQLARRVIPARGPRVAEPLSETDFPGPYLPRGQYLWPDGTLVNLVWDSPRGRYAMYGSTIVEFGPGTWNIVHRSVPSVDRWGPEGNRSNPRANPHSLAILNERMSSDGGAMYYWFDANGKQLNFHGDSLEFRDGRSYSRRYAALAPGETLSRVDLECFDLETRKQYWIRKSMSPGATQIQGNPISPYRNGSWVGDFLLAIARPSKTSGQILVLLDGKTGETRWRQPMPPSARVVAITGSYVLLACDGPPRLECWTLRD